MFGAPTYQAVALLIIVLAIIFLFLLAYTFWTRTKKKYWTRYGQKFKDLFAPIIFEYIDTARRKSDADAVVKRITRRQQDLELFINLVENVTEILHGDDRHKLNWLVQHPIFHNYYKDKLNSPLRSDQLLGCVYFAKCGFVKLKIAIRLFEISSSKDIKLAYGAAKALQNSTNHEMRLSTLKDFFEREDATNLMIGELLHLYYTNSRQMKQESEEYFKELLITKEVPRDRKEIIIEYIAHHNLYEFSTFLLNYLDRLLYRPENKSLIKQLINTLGILRIEEAGPLIRAYANYPDTDLRICCVEALNHLGGEQNLAFITNMLLDIEFDVRKRIIETLVHDPDDGHLMLEKFMLNYLKFLSKVWASDVPSRDLLIFISKLRSITHGIRIVSANKNRLSKPVQV